MKNIFIALFLLFAFNSQAQSWDAKMEDAQFQVRVNNYSAYTSEVKKVQGLFTRKDFKIISNRCLTKEGVFKLELSQDFSTIVVYYVSWIDDVTINWLFTDAIPTLESNIHILPKAEHTF